VVVVVQQYQSHELRPDYTFYRSRADHDLGIQCVDAGWNTMTGGTWQSLVTYAAGKNVGITLWYNACGRITPDYNRPARQTLRFIGA